MIRKISITFALTMAFGFGLAWAGGMEKYQVPFNQIDGNGDGGLEWSEYDAHFKPGDREAFDLLDGNKDARIDREEWHKFQSAHGMEGQGMKQMGAAGKKPFHDKALPDPAPYMKHMGDLDQDGDDAMTFAEFEKAFPQGEPKKVFDAIDLDHDSSISHDEWHAFKQAHGCKQ